MYLTSFQELAGFALGSNKPECGQSGSARLNPIAEKSCTSTGHISPSTPTSENSTVSIIGEASTLSAVATPASPSVAPARDAAQQMKDISGRKCIGLYGRSGRDGSLPKMLLDILASVSTRLPHRWKLRASPSGRLLFQLAPLTRRTDGIAFGLLPTPTVQMRGRPEIAIQQALKGDPLYKRRDKAGNGRQFSITDYLIYRSLLPTPTASDCKGASDNCRRVREQKLSYLRYYLHSHQKPSSVTSYPHPSFVERMMGYPIGHTALNPSETPLFRRSRRSSAPPSCGSNDATTGGDTSPSDKT